MYPRLEGFQSLSKYSPPPYLLHPLWGYFTFQETLIVSPSSLLSAPPPENTSGFLSKAIMEVSEIFALDRVEGRAVKI